MVQDIDISMKEVYARMHAGNNFCWKPGQVVERVGNVIYNVLIHGGKLIRAHVNQLRKNHRLDTNTDIDPDWNMALEVFENPIDKENNQATVTTTEDRNEDVDTPTLRRSQPSRKPVTRYSPS